MLSPDLDKRRFDQNMHGRLTNHVLEFSRNETAEEQSFPRLQDQSFS